MIAHSINYVGRLITCTRLRRLSQAYLLHALGDLVVNSGQQLYEGVGVQAIIDVMRLHVCRQKSEVVSGQVRLLMLLLMRLHKQLSRTILKRYERL
jgi:hypothetical protein